MLAGEQEGAHDRLAVDRLGDLVGVLEHHREQVGQQVVLERREVGGHAHRAVVAVLGLIDRAMRGHGDGAVVVLWGAAGDRHAARVARAELVHAPVLGVAQAASLWVSPLVRNRRPSSSRRW